MAATPPQVFARLSAVEPPGETPVRLDRAVVLGASVAGLLAARVLSDHAREVVIIERDLTPPAVGPRPGVPQGGQVHSLLGAGQAQLERWFPGFYRELADSGSVRINLDIAEYVMNGRPRQVSPTPPPEPPLINTRPLLEGRIRARVEALPNVRVVGGRAAGLVFAGDRVSGVVYHPLIDGGEGEPVTADADLVVDGMGRSSRLSEWLGAAGWPKPPMRRMGIKLTYATAYFERSTPDDEAVSLISHVTAGPGRKPQIGGVLPVEGGRWMMLIAGYGDDRPERDIEDFRRRCREDFPPLFGEVATTCPLIGDVLTYHQADSRRRDFSAMDRLPAGIVATGDAVASFNPIYGQGMTSAALHASALSEYLRSVPDLDQPATAYFELVKVVVDVAWQVSTLADLALPHVDGPYPRGYKVIDWIGSVIYQASMVDRQVLDRLSKVTAMLDHPNALMDPGLLLRALRLRVFPPRPRAAID